MPIRFTALALSLLLVPAVARADCFDGGGGGGSGDGWGILAALGLTTSICFTSTTTAAALQPSTDSEPEEKPRELTEGEKRYRRQVEFIADNADNLRRDAAYGRGEYLDAYLTLLGCAPVSHETARELIRVHGPTIFEPDSPDEILTRTQLALGLDDGVAAACALPMPRS